MLMLQLFSCDVSRWESLPGWCSTAAVVYTTRVHLCLYSYVDYINTEVD